jgi:hypothetical protein
VLAFCVTSPPAPDEPKADPSALDFSRAEYDEQKGQGSVCAFCKKAISLQYWQVATHVACEQCQGEVARSVEHGSSAKAFLGAMRLGALAAAAGSLGWIIVTKATGYQLGIVAIGIGILVGKAVRKGAGGFGSRRLQVLAVALAYAAISLASLPELLEAVRGAGASNGTHPTPSLGAFLWGWCVLIGIALASPFLGGTENFMGLIIIGIGLYEAWKYSAPAAVQILGPFQLAPISPGAEPSAAVASRVEPAANESV